MVGVRLMEKYILKFAEIEDLASWMDMVEIVRYNFPLLEKDEELAKYKDIVIKNIKRKSALCVKDGNIVIGILIFSYNQKCLSCMAVHPDYRRRGIATALIEIMISVLPSDEDIWVITFREDDEKGKSPRALYKRIGFKEAELLMEHNYPHQKFVLYRK